MNKIFILESIPRKATKDVSEDAYLTEVVTNLLLVLFVRWLEIVLMYLEECALSWVLTLSRRWMFLTLRGIAFQLGVVSC